MHIRPARISDAEALLAIYAPFVEHTSVSFETAPPSVDEFAHRIEKVLGRWQWLVAEDDGRCVGYAYGSQHRERAAYRYSCEVSVYLAPTHLRQGLGRCLYGELLPQLAALGYCNAFAGIAQPNEASVAVHRAVGFTPIGLFEAVGRKFGRWHDVLWMQRRLRDAPLDGG